MRNEEPSSNLSICFRTIDQKTQGRETKYSCCRPKGVKSSAPNLYVQVFRKARSPVAVKPVPATVALCSFAASADGGAPEVGYRAPSMIASLNLVEFQVDLNQFKIDFQSTYVDEQGELALSRNQLE